MQIVAKNIYFLPNELELVSWTLTHNKLNFCCGNYSREEILSGNTVINFLRKKFEEPRY